MLTPGELIEGKYRIIRLIGEGGMGAVYEGENTRIQRRVAIKVLHAQVASNQESVQRFEREAQAAGRIGNEHILEVLDLGSLPNGDHFMVMEYLDGEPLSERIRSAGRMRPEDLTRIAIQALDGLAAAHDVGIVHRDLKPDNIFVLREKLGHKDFVKLIDFGISKFQPLSGGEMKMTRTGTVMGTPYYMSPEQASGSREADHRSDLYAMGVILYEAVTGRVPFDAPTFNQLLFQIVLSEPPPAEQVVPDLNPGFASIITKAMARDADHRFQSAKQFSEALRTWLASGASVSVPPPADVNPLLPRSNQGSSPAFAPTPMPGERASMSALGASSAGPGTSAPNTVAAWATAPSERIPTSKAPVIVLAVLGFLVLAGGAFGAYRWLGHKAPDTPTDVASTAISSQPTSPVESAPIPVIPQIPAVDSAVVDPVASAPVASAVPSASVAAPASAQAAAATAAAPKGRARHTSSVPVRRAPANPGGSNVDFGY